MNKHLNAEFDAFATIVKPLKRSQTVYRYTVYTIGLVKNLNLHIQILYHELRCFEPPQSRRRVGSWGLCCFTVDGTLSLTGVKVANVVAYFCSVVATALPGRIDGADQRIGKDEDNEMIKLSTGKKGRTLVAPSGWYAMMNARLLLLLYTPPSLLIISVLSLTC